MKSFIEKNKVALGLFILLFVLTGGIAYSQHTFSEKTDNEDKEKVKELTYAFLSNFKRGVPLNEKVYTNVTYEYFPRDFLENVLPKEKSRLFGAFGYGRLTHEYTALGGVIKEGGIKAFKITSVERDNVNKTITAYIEMDAWEPNTIHWIEWRDVPSEGWKINTVSFDGHIKVLEAPLSPQK